MIRTCPSWFVYIRAVSMDHLHPALCGRHCRDTPPASRAPSGPRVNQHEYLYEDKDGCIRIRIDRDTSRHAGLSSMHTETGRSQVATSMNRKRGEQKWPWAGEEVEVGDVVLGGCWPSGSWQSSFASTTWFSFIGPDGAKTGKHRGRIA